MLAAACSNEDNMIVDSPEDNVTGDVKMITETITATNSDSKSTTRADVNDMAKFTWSESDKIAVHVSDGKYYTAELTSGEGTNEAEFTVEYPEGKERDAFAVYPASIVAAEATNYGQDGEVLDVTLPASYTLAEVSGTKTPCPMIATNNPEVSGWEFKQLCGLLRLTVNNIPASTSYLEIDFNGKKVQGVFSIDSPVPGASVIETSSTEGTDDIITITDLGISGWTDGMVLNLPLPTGNYTEVTVTAYNSNNLPVHHITSDFSYNANRAKGRKVTASMPAPISVSADKKVVFAPGNLQYLGNADGTGIWRFAEHQYDFMGDGPSSQTDYQGNVSVDGFTKYNASADMDVARDLFGWGTSGNDNKNPWMTSKSSGSYYNGSITDTDYDWGVYHRESGNSNVKITKGGNYSWRLFTGDEWAYVVNRTGRVYTRENYSETKNLFASATVVGVKGIIIFPDSWDGSLDTSIKYGNASNAGYDKLICDAEKWAKFEKQGCVFLPAAHVRSGVAMDYLNQGHYWASTTVYTVGEYRGGTLEFSNKGTVTLNSTNNCVRRLGQSVRLIRDVE